MDSVAIVTPIWKPTLDDRERDFVSITQKTSPQIDKIFCAPADLDVTDYRRQFPEWQFEFFDPHHFQSVKHYSLWLTEPEFYERFTGYEFICLCQTDAVLIKDITEIDMTNIDYLGAPWDPPIKVLRLGTRLYVSTAFDETPAPWPVRLFGRKVSVGNGGLSLRRVQALIDVANRISSAFPDQRREHILEDALFSAQGPRFGLRVASSDQANQVFWESTARKATQIPNAYGFHGLWRWNPNLAKELTA